MGTEVVYPCRQGPNEELRYSLRSLQNLPHGNIVIAGSWPDWVRNVTKVPVGRQRSKYEQTTANILAALPFVGERFWLFNDDFFVMRDVHTWHRGPLVDVAPNVGPDHRRAMRLAAEHLEQRGLPSLCYEVHAPLLVERDAIAEVLSDLPRRSPLHMTKRSLYGNTYRIGGELTHDFKTSEAESWPVLSTNEAVFARKPVGELIRSRFPEPSPYEE